MEAVAGMLGRYIAGQLARLYESMRYLEFAHALISIIP